MRRHAIGPINRVATELEKLINLKNGKGDSAVVSSGGLYTAMSGLTTQLMTFKNNVPGWETAIAAIGTAFTVTAAVIRAAKAAKTLGISEIIALITSLVSIAAAWVSSMGNEVVPEVERFSDAISQTTRDMLNPIIDATNRARDALRQFWSEKREITLADSKRISGYFSDMANSAIDSLERMRNRALEVIREMFGEEGAEFERHLQRIDRFYDGRIDSIRRENDALRDNISMAIIYYEEGSEAHSDAVEAHRKHTEYMIYQIARLNRYRDRERDKARENASDEIQEMLGLLDQVNDHYNARVNTAQEALDEINQATRRSLRENREISDGAYRGMVADVTLFYERLLEATVHGQAEITEATRLWRAGLTPIERSALRTRENMHEVRNIQSYWRGVHHDPITGERIITPVPSDGRRNRHPAFQEAIDARIPQLPAWSRGLPDITARIEPVLSTGSLENLVTDVQDGLTAAVEDAITGTIMGARIGRIHSAPPFTGAMTLSSPSAIAPIGFAGAYVDTDGAANSSVLYDTAVEANMVLGSALSGFAGQIVEAIRDNKPVAIIGDKDIFEASQRGEFEYKRMIGE